MHRYFVSEKSGKKFYLEDDNFHHAKNVVKLKQNEEIVCIFNNVSYLCKIETINQKLIIANVIRELSLVEKNFKVTLIIGIIREQKWDLVLQKATELNVDLIVPVVFKRNVVKIDKSKIYKKIQRWNKICEDASEQSYRNNIPVISEIVYDLKNIKNFKSECNLTLWENGNIISLKDEYKLQNSFSFVIGPEGGIDESEIVILEECGFKTVKFLNSILKAETVPIYILSTLNFWFE